ncbi:HPP family protein [Peribacillus asahii]|uniref:HPP family protein n=1 Tax=Peribacillus asahii TaxID=228899 RepID=UPI00207B040A|nr:HPP family protein [Peribacillus asahii]USK70798.1 HPP family protein [Peribacillus asahii]
MNLEKSLEKNWSNRSTTNLTAYLGKMKGEARLGSQIDYVDAIISAIGGVIAIITVGFIAIHLGYPMALGPLGASCVLVFLAHKGPFSQPRHIIGGHLFSITLALIMWSILGKSLFTIGLVLALVLILMTLTTTVHPPAAASALVAVNSQAGWGFLISVVICSLLLVFISTIYNNLFPTRQYPKHWF